ncbi:MAG: T9SS type A sorting domain-containing protein [Bacteroidia bacterium]
MRKLLLLSGFIVCLATATAQTSLYQPFPASDALWADESNPGSYNTQCGIFGDTVLGTTTWHKLYQRVMGCPDSSMNIGNSDLIGAIMEDGSKRVFFHAFNYMLLSPGSEWKLYDFSKTTVGDTLQFNGTGYSKPLLTISAMDSVMIGGSYRKRFHFAEGETWIEGVGSMRTLLSMVTPYPTCSCTLALLCYKQAGALTYVNPAYNYCYCDLGVGITENEAQLAEFYPNPVNDQLKIKTSGSETVSIYNNLGELQRSYPANGSMDQTIETLGLPEGMYYILIQNKISRKSGKFVVQR